MQLFQILMNYIELFNQYSLQNYIVYTQCDKIIISHFQLITIYQLDMNFSLCKSSFIRNQKESIFKHYSFSENEIGRGGFGVVFKGYHKEQPKISRAIKRIPKKPHRNCPPYTIEIENLKVLDHPGITRLYETFEDENFVYLVLDLCQGQQLFERLEKEGNFTEKDARQIFTQMLETVSYLHKMKIAHRDLKAENFLFLQKGSLSVKLIDFGFSYRWNQNMEQQLIESDQHKKIVGSAYYISPQVIASKYDQRTDIWSLGVILYILVTGSPPFDGLTDAKIFQAIRKGQFNTKILDFRKVSPACKDLISKILKPVNKRISIAEIFEHEWMCSSGLSLSRNQLKINFNNMKNFAKFNKLKAIIAQLIASQLPQKQIEELGALFKDLDKNHDGHITIEQLQAGLQRQKQYTNLEQLKKIIKSINFDHQGKINYNEFVASLLDKSVIEDKDNLKNVFNMIDTDGNGTIERCQLKEILLNKQSRSRKEEAQKSIDILIHECDQNGDGKIDFCSFMKAMKYS